MKRLVMGAVLSFVLLSCGNVWAKNMVSNGGFEDDSLGWAGHGTSSLSGGTIDTTIVHGGSKSLKLVSSTDKWAGALAVQKVTVERGATYTVQAYGYKENACGAYLFVLSNSTFTVPGVGKWHLVTIPEVKAVGDADYINVYLNAQQAANATAYFDDVSVTLVRSREDNKIHYQAMLDDKEATAKAKAEANLFFANTYQYIEKNVAKTMRYLGQLDDIGSIARLIKIQNLASRPLDAFTSCSKAIDLLRSKADEASIKAEQDIMALRDDISQRHFGKSYMDYITSPTE